MAEQMTVPDVFPAEVDQLVDDRDGVPARIDSEVAHGAADRVGYVQCPDAVGHGEGYDREDRPQGHNDIFQRAHADGVFPTNFVGIRGPDGAIPTYPVDHLHIEQVEVERMRIDAVMRDAPDLGTIRQSADRL